MKYSLRYTLAFFLICFQSNGSYATTVTDLDKLGEEQRVAIFKSHINTDPKLFKPIYQMAKDVSELLEKNGIRYWATFGTLLGAVRQTNEANGIRGGLPRWDDDIDFGIHEDDAPKIGSNPFKDELYSLGYAIGEDAGEK